jgi:hypothetical protein
LGCLKLVADGAAFQATGVPFAATARRFGMKRAVRARMTLVSETMGGTGEIYAFSSFVTPRSLFWEKASLPFPKCLVELRRLCVPESMDSH